MKFMLRSSLLSMLALANFGWAAVPGHWTGYISDAKCGAKGIGNVACARKCIKAGAAYAFIADHSHAVLVIKNPRRFARDLGRHVRVSGIVHGHSIEITRVRRLRS